MQFANGFKSIVIAGAVLTIANLVVRPIINVLLLPINLITFNLFKWVTYALTLYLVTLVADGFKIVSFTFAGLSSRWIDIPSINLTGFLAYVAFSFVIAMISSFIAWVMK